MNNELIQIINNSTEKKITDAGITKKFEFIDKNSNSIPEGIPYHIHITTDKKYWYMTSSDHEGDSILIFKVKGDIPDYVKYKNLVGSERQEYLTEQRSIPNDLDYKSGYIRLFFARQANAEDEKVFEISEHDFRKDTPFYSKVSLQLKIFGERNEVEMFNLRRMNVANSRLRGLEYVVQPLQYFRPIKETTDDVKERLKRYQQVSSGTSTTTTSGGY
jgi:hypothetical protein